MLYIMRHGRTDWNDAYKLQGRTDIPLNDAGRRMAQEAAQRYREVCQIRNLPLEEFWSAGIEKCKLMKLI